MTERERNIEKSILMGLFIDKNIPEEIVAIIDSIMKDAPNFVVEKDVDFAFFDAIFDSRETNKTFISKYGKIKSKISDEYLVRFIKETALAISNAIEIAILKNHTNYFDLDYVLDSETRSYLNEIQEVSCEEKYSSILDSKIKDNSVFLNKLIQMLIDIRVSNKSKKFSLNLFEY